MNLLDALELLHQNPFESSRELGNVWVEDASFIEKTRDGALWSEVEKGVLKRFFSEPYLVQLNLSLEVASYGRMPFSEVRAVLKRVVEIIDE